MFAFCRSFWHGCRSVVALLHACHGFFPRVIKHACVMQNTKYRWKVSAGRFLVRATGRASRVMSSSSLVLAMARCATGFVQRESPMLWTSFVGHDKMNKNRLRQKKLESPVVFKILKRYLPHCFATYLAIAFVWHRTSPSTSKIGKPPNGVPEQREKTWNVEFSKHNKNKCIKKKKFSKIGKWHIGKRPYKIHVSYCSLAAAIALLPGARLRKLFRLEQISDVRSQHDRAHWNMLICISWPFLFFGYFTNYPRQQSFPNVLLECWNLRIRATICAHAERIVIDGNPEDLFATQKSVYTEAPRAGCVYLRADRDGLCYCQW